MVKTFKEYYADPEFKEKHQKYMLEPIECECGCKVMRSNISKHKKTPKHTKMMDKKEVNINEETYNRLLNKIKKDLKL
jgi:hypothetical protein